MLVYERVSLVEKPTKILSAIQVKLRQFRILAMLIYWLQTDKGQYKAGDVVKLRLLLHDNFLRKESNWLQTKSKIYSMISSRLIDKDHLVALGKEVSTNCNKTQQKNLLSQEHFRMPWLVLGKDVAKWHGIMA